MFIEDNNKDMLVSVIIPVYNVASYLYEALDSVIHQSYQNLEIIIIDDGSTDDSKHICDEYAMKDNRISVIHQENRGLSAARNVGLQYMTGDAVVFLDSDDAFQLNYIKCMVEALIENNADLVVCRYSIHHTTQKMYDSFPQKIEPSVESGIYNRTNCLRALVDGVINISTWNKIYKKKLWNNIRFPVGHVFEEQQTILEVVNLCNLVCVIDQPLYMYRIRPGSITHCLSPLYMSDLVFAYSYVDSFVSKYSLDVFSVNQVNRVRADYLKKLLSIYCHASFQNGENWRLFCVKLRKQIVNLKKSRYLLKNRYKIAFYIIRFCPLILKIVYPIYKQL